MRRLMPLVFVLLAITIPVATQNPDQLPPAPQTEQEQLEEEFIRSRIANGESHASGARPELGPIVLGNPTTATISIRVGLNVSTLNASGGVVNEFASLHHPFVELSNTDGDVKVVDRSTGKEITVMAAGSRVRVEHDGLTGFLVTQDGLFLGAFDGPVFFRSTSRANLFRVENLRRVFSGTKVPLYRGAMEVARGPVTSGLSVPRVNLVNILAIEDYVPGVVANESIASFSIEALKAQAVAARGYAVANIGNYVARGYPFDIVDSSSSQVYRGVISEHVNAVRAASETHGLVASSDGRIIGAMYSSSFGGHSESNEWISFFANRVAGGAPLSYLRGIYDGTGDAPDLTTETGIDFFWRTQPPSPLIHDDCAWTGNGFSRWAIELPASLIRTRLTTNATTLISGARGGIITDVAITERTAASARAAAARITTADPAGVVEVRGWESLRQILGRNGAATAPRACGTARIAVNFLLNNPSSLAVSKNADGTVSSVTAYGGGWGHNLGMSQYGAHGRGKLGQDFIEILGAYYTGVNIGSFPIDIGRQPGGAPTLRQEFVAPNAEGTLEIRAEDLQGLRVHVNELYDLTFDAAALAAGLVQVDISEYLHAGLNVIQYNPVGRDGRATVTVVVR